MNHGYIDSYHRLNPGIGVYIQNVEAVYSHGGFNLGLRV
jgi:hypothetical protein